VKSATLARQVALFRGINVGKAKRIAMADLRGLLVGLGYTEVRTLLNSGNAVFTGEGEASAMARRIRDEVSRKLGVDALVIVKSAAEIAAVMRGNALESLAQDHSRLVVALTNDAASIAALKKLASKTCGEEKLHVNRHAAYLWCARGILESKAAEALLAQLKDCGTTRNWGTLSKIHALLSA
jgi:uncharacterized protein (DUF1697 family)